MLTSFHAPLRAAVIGAGGGLGGAFVRTLGADAAVGRIEAFARNAAPAATGKVVSHQLDLDDDASLDAAAAVLGDGPSLDLVVVATGMLHDQGRGLAPEKSWRQLDRSALLRSFEVNAVGPALLAGRLLPLLRRDHKAAFAVLSARVGSIEDNRLGGWYAYRAAKAALNQLVRTLAVELARRAPEALCVGLHPGTVDTSLSKPFQGGVPHGSLVPPDDAARRLLGVLDGLGPGDTGRLFAWDGARVPF